MRIVIVEDETAATTNLISIISGICPDSSIVAALESVREAVEWFGRNESPDIVFMDIHLADGDAFRIFDAVRIEAPVIFTTAYDRYALDAFKVNSIDYLLKPIKPADVRRAMDKLALLTQSDKTVYADRIEKLLGDRKSPTFLVNVKDRIIPVKAEEVAFFYTSDEKIAVHTLEGNVMPYDKPLDSIMGSLPPYEYFRANRQFIISRAAIDNISVWFGGRLSLNLKIPTPEKIIISKAKVPEFKKWLIM